MVSVRYGGENGVFERYGGAVRRRQWRLRAVRRCGAAATMTSSSGAAAHRRQWHLRAVRRQQWRLLAMVLEYVAVMMPNLEFWDTVFFWIQQLRSWLLARRSSASVVALTDHEMSSRLVLSWLIIISSLLVVSMGLPYRLDYVKMLATSFSMDYLLVVLDLWLLLQWPLSRMQFLLSLALLIGFKLGRGEEAISMSSSSTAKKTPDQMGLDATVTLGKER
ncbi:hypothetical protein L6452_15765 [Arctium lappa]|uniref:Uncharacterized protein n=1 Tax=Arctium lappa TaxID=4217 RepID=A0ACB9CQ86_ARCLA|nr:hypothetical protein L6452_15765 [Arctium lappa]